MIARTARNCLCTFYCVCFDYLHCPQMVFTRPKVAEHFTKCLQSVQLRKLFWLHLGNKALKALFPQIDRIFLCKSLPDSWSLFTPNIPNFEKKPAQEGSTRSHLSCIDRQTWSFKVNILSRWWNKNVQFTPYSSTPSPSTTTILIIICAENQP